MCLIQDTGLSVRKRVIKIFRELVTAEWINDSGVLSSSSPSFNGARLCGQSHTRLSDMCFRLVGRLKDDEESIKKLLVELFNALWFSPIGSGSSAGFASSRSRATAVEGSRIARRVQSILDVIGICRASNASAGASCAANSNNNNYEWFEKLLKTLIEPPASSSTSLGMREKREATADPNAPQEELDVETDGGSKNLTELNERIANVELACKQIVDQLIQSLLTSEEQSAAAALASVTSQSSPDSEDSGFAGSANSASSEQSQPLVTSKAIEEHTTSSSKPKPAGAAASNEQIIICLTALYLFAKVKPSLLVPHIDLIQPYLCLEPTASCDLEKIYFSARTLELVIPLLEHPSPHFCNRLEDDLVKLIFKSPPILLPSCVACLAVAVSSLSKNYKLLWDVFQRFVNVLQRALAEHRASSRVAPELRGALQRCLYSVGLLLKHCDIDDVHKRVVNPAASATLPTLFPTITNAANKGLPIAPLPKARIRIQFCILTHTRVYVYEYEYDGCSTSNIF